MHTGEEIKRGMGRWMAIDKGMQQLSSSNTASKADYNYLSSLVTNYFCRFVLFIQKINLLLAFKDCKCQNVW